MNGSTPRIRGARPDDAAAIATIYNASIAAGDATMDRTPKPATAIRAWMRGFHEREALLVLEHSGTLLGWGLVKRYSDRAGYRFCCETSVYLDRTQHGRGYGSQLQDALMNRCRAFGYHHLVAKVFADNEASLHLHEKFGYELVGVQQEIGYLDGHWQDVAILQCLLPPDEAD